MGNLSSYLDKPILRHQKKKKKKKREVYKENEKSRARLVHVFKHMFSIFKQHYTYFHIHFYPHVFPKKQKTVVYTRTKQAPSIFKVNIPMFIKKKINMGVEEYYS